MKNILFILGLFISVIALGQDSEYTDLDVKAATAGTDGHTIFDAGKAWKMTHTVLFSNTTDSLEDHLTRIEALEAAGSSLTFENGLTEAGGTVTLGGALTGNTSLLGGGLRSFTAGSSGSRMTDFLSYVTTDIILNAEDDVNIVAADYIILDHNTNGKGLTINPINIEFYDADDQVGVVYAADYSANYTARSIPDSAHVAAMIDAEELLDLNTWTGTSHTLTIDEKSYYLTFTNVSDITLTVPPNSTAAFPLGTQITIEQGSVGQIIVTPGGGVTIRSADTKLKTRVQFSVATLIKKGTDVWTLTGDIAL